jgi:hypothetical protein
MQGTLDRGNGGLVYVKGDECAYVFPNELNGGDEIKETLTELLENEHAARVFYVVEERDSKLHVLAYPRDQVLADMVVESRPECEPTAPQIEERELENNVEQAKNAAISRQGPQV